MNGFIALFKAGLPEPVVNPGVFKRKEKDVGSLVKKIKRCQSDEGAPEPVVNPGVLKRKEKDGGSLVCRNIRDVRGAPEPVNPEVDPLCQLVHNQ